MAERRSSGVQDDLNRILARAVAQGETYPKLGADTGRWRVPVDRPDPADDPDEPGHSRLSDNPHTPDAAPLLPLDQANRVAVHRANQAQVEQAYAASNGTAGDYTRGATADADADRSSRAEALPSLRAAWEQHQDRYPERERATPQTHADGSWSSGETRRLTPEQNAEATKACADIHDEGKRFALRAMREIEGADPSRRLVGVEYMLKGVDRLKEKIADALRARPGLTAWQVLSIVPDPVRFTFEYSPDRYADGVLADVEHLKEIGLEELKLKNLWSDEQYKGINSQWRRPETGLRIEVQFHTPASLEAKELTHRAYERIRNPGTSPAERGELEAFQRRVNALLDTPSGTTEIPDFPEK